MIKPQHVKTKVFEIGDIKIGGDEPYVLIAGPCQIEGMDHALMMAERIAEACAPTGTRFIYKSSYDKANRSSVSTARGIGMEEGMRILQAVKDQFGAKPYSRPAPTVPPQRVSLAESISAPAGMV